MNADEAIAVFRITAKLALQSAKSRVAIPMVRFMLVFRGLGIEATVAHPQPFVK